MNEFMKRKKKKEKKKEKEKEKIYFDCHLPTLKIEFAKSLAVPFSKGAASATQKSLSMSEETGRMLIVTQEGFSEDDLFDSATKTVLSGQRETRLHAKPVQL